MKTILTKFMVFGSIILLMLSACKKEGALVTSNGGKAGTLSSSATTLVLQKASISDTTKVIKFTFTQADYGYSAAVSNTLQIDKAGDNWANPTSVTLNAKVLSQGYSTIDFDNMLLKLGLTGGTASSINVRVAHSISASVTPIYSNVVAMTVTAFNLTSFLYVPGAYQGWNPATADSLLSATSNGIYTGIINFTAGNSDFKITPAKTWTNSYGATNSTTLVYNGGGNITSPIVGLTQVTVNLNTNTITFVAVQYYYSIIGDATPGGWSTDTDMKYDNGNQVWTVTAPLTTGGALKVRRNHDWGTSYGTLTTPDGKTFTSSNGGNLPVTASGNYKFTFALIPTDLSGGTASYTLVKVN